MEMKWSLDSLYPGFDSKNFKEDRSKFEDKIEELEEWNFAEGNKLENIEDFILTLKDYYKLSMRLKAFSHLTVSVDAKNEEALKMIEKIEKEMVRTTKPMVNFQLYLREIVNR